MEERRSSRVCWLAARLQGLFKASSRPAHCALAVCVFECCIPAALYEQRENAVLKSFTNNAAAAALKCVRVVKPLLGEFK